MGFPRSFFGLPEPEPDVPAPAPVLAPAPAPEPPAIAKNMDYLEKRFSSNGLQNKPNEKPKEEVPFELAQQVTGEQVVPTVSSMTKTVSSSSSSGKENFLTADVVVVTSFPWWWWPIFLFLVVLLCLLVPFVIYLRRDGQVRILESCQLQRPSR
jgi:hypothetical protein